MIYSINSTMINSWHQYLIVKLVFDNSILFIPEIDFDLR